MDAPIVRYEGTGTTDRRFMSADERGSIIALPNSSTDARGNTTDYTYDATHGGPLTVTQPAPSIGAVRPQTRLSYTAVAGPSGQSVAMPTQISACQTLSSCTNGADETRTTAAYNSNLLPTSVSSGNGNGTLTATNTLTYDQRGNLSMVDGPLAGTADTIKYRYDSAGQRIGTISPDPDGAGALKHRAVRLTYRPDGQVSKQELGNVNSQSDADWALFAPLQTVDVTFDSNSRAATQKLSGGGTAFALTQMSYDALGRPDCSARRMNSAVFGSLPASACALGTQGSFGPDRIGQAVYDAAGQVTQQRQAVGTADAATERTLTYSNNGALATLKDAEANLTTYEYDGHDRLSKTRFPVTTKGANASSATDFEQLTYDAAANVTARRLRDGNSIAFTFDNLNRVTLKNLPGTEPDVTYAYDNLGRLTSASQTGNALSFTYDALSRNLTQAGPQGTVASAWDLAGRRTQLTYPGTGLFVNMDYLVTGETTKVRENGASSGVGVLATYAYDDLGRRTSTTFGNGAAQAFTYDPVSRLASLSNDLTSTANDLSATFAYNPASQITSNVRTGDAYAYGGLVAVNRNYTANGLNQYTAAGPASFTYDAKGNLTSDGTNSFTYSSENLLLTGPGSTTLSYDPQLRLQQIVSGGATTKLAYDGLDRIAEYDGSSNLLRRYVHGPGMDAPIVWYEGSGTTDRRFLSSDERGSIISVTDSSGTLLGLNRYDEYGIPQSTNLGVWGYTGQAWLPSIGVWYYKNRMYSATGGRFMQTDPIGYWDNANLYAYVGNDPVNLVDPLRLCGMNEIKMWKTVESAGSGGEIVATAYSTCVGMPNVGSGSGGGGMSGGGFGGGGGGNQCSTGGTSLLNEIGGFLLGVDDALTLGQYSKAASKISNRDLSASTNTVSYTSGQIGTAILSAGRLGYAAIARSFASLSGAEAVAARNSLKGVMSGFGSSHPRAMTYQQALAKYKTDAAVAAAASRTNSKANAAAAYGAASSVASSKKGCG